LDCLFFPFAPEQALAVTSAFGPSDLKKVERYVDVTDVPEKFAYEGWTNSVVVGNRVFWDQSPNPNNPDINAASIKAHDELIESLGFEGVNVDLGEFSKSGGDLSCLCLSMNHEGRNDQLGPHFRTS